MANASGAVEMGPPVVIGVGRDPPFATEAEREPSFELGADREFPVVTELGRGPVVVMEVESGPPVVVGLARGPFVVMEMGRELSVDAKELERGPLVVMGAEGTVFDVVELGKGPPDVMGLEWGAPPVEFLPPLPLLPSRDAEVVGQLSFVGTVVYAPHPTVVVPPVVVGSRGTLIPPQLQ